MVFALDFSGKQHALSNCIEVVNGELYHIKGLFNHCQHVGYVTCPLSSQQPLPS